MSVAHLRVTEKSFATAAAKAALAGWQLWRSDSDDGVVRYFIGRWNLIRVLPSLAEVEAFLERAGVDA